MKSHAPEGSAIQSWQDYTPVWTAEVTNPSLGNGTLLGRYIRIGNLVVVRIYLTAGTTTTFGSNPWHFSLPLSVRPQSGIFSFVGSAWGLDNSLTAYYVAAPRTTAAPDVIIYNASSGAPWQSNVPFVWATNDAVAITVVYETDAP